MLGFFVYDLHTPFKVQISKDKRRVFVRLLLFWLEGFSVVFFLLVGGRGMLRFAQKQRFHPAKTQQFLWCLETESPETQEEKHN